MTIKNSAICNGAKINSQCEILKAIVAPNATILDKSVLAANSVIGERVELGCNGSAGPVIISDVKSVNIFFNSTSATRLL